MVLWDNITHSVNSFKTPIIIMGDFNVVGEAADKVGGNPDISKSIEEFQEFISGAHLLEVPFKGISYTWTNNRDKS